LKALRHSLHLLVIGIIGFTLYGIYEFQFEAGIIYSMVLFLVILNYLTDYPIWSKPKWLNFKKKKKLTKVDSLMEHTVNSDDWLDEKYR
jgi:hypothetical protein